MFAEWNPSRISTRIDLETIEGHRWKSRIVRVEEGKTSGKSEKLNFPASFFSLPFVSDARLYVSIALHPRSVDRCACSEWRLFASAGLSP